MDIISILMIVEIILSAMLTFIIVIQPSSADAGTLFGGGFGDEVERTKRGSELFLHNATIILGVFWVALAITIMLLGR